MALGEAWGSPIGVAAVNRSPAQLRFRAVWANSPTLFHLGVTGTAIERSAIPGDVFLPGAVSVLVDASAVSIARAFVNAERAPYSAPQVLHSTAQLHRVHLDVSPF